MTTITAPHPSLQDATFCYAWTGDGAAAVLVQGWEALCLMVEGEFACGPDEKWRDLLADLGRWLNDGDGVPFTTSDHFEDGAMAIYRVSPHGVKTCGHCQHPLQGDKPAKDCPTGWRCAHLTPEQSEEMRQRPAGVAPSDQPKGEA